METISLRINKKDLTCSPGISILDAATSNGISIPTLCHHPELKPHGACRLCLVEDEVSGRLYASCVTPVSDGLSVLTHTDRVMEHRKTIVSLIMAAHPESCLVCAKGNACDLRKIATDLGLGYRTLYPMPQYRPQDQSNPFIFRDITKCILCGKCIRGCKELVVTGTLEYSQRGFESKPLTALDTPLAGSDCTFCGTCVTLCPTGALLPASSVAEGTAFGRKESVCGFCGSGCRISLGINGNRIVDVQPSETTTSSNGLTLCVRGHFGLDFLDSPKRLTDPMTGQGEDRRIASWDEALDHVAKEFTEIKERFGPDAIGFYGSSKCSNEENFLFQKIARQGMGTPHIDNGGSLYGRTAMEYLDTLTAGAAGTRPFSDLSKAGVILVAGAQPEHSAPVFNYHIKRAVKNGASLIVIDHRAGDLTRHADLWLHPGSGTDLSVFYPVFAQCLSLRLEEGDRRKWSGLSKQIGLTEDRIEQAFQLIKGKQAALVLGESVCGEPALSAWANLASIIRCMTAKGFGLHMMSRENNLVGAWDMGTTPTSLPGRMALSDAKQGMSITAMIQAARNGTLKALYIMGENPLRALPQSAQVQEALMKIECLVVQDILETKTTALAHVLLPGAAFTEKQGSFTTMESRVQLFEQAVKPPGQARSDFDILCQLAGLLGMEKQSISDIRKEIEIQVSAYKGLSKSKDFFWAQRPTPKKKALPIPVQPMPGSSPIKNYPLTAVIDSSHFHAGCGTRTHQSKRLSQAPDRSAIRVSAKTATSHGLDENSLIRVISPHGSLSREVAVKEDLIDDILYIPRAFHGNDVMNLFDPDDGNTPFMCRVRIEKSERT